MERSMFFNSSADDIRSYNAEDFSTVFKNIVSNGVVGNGLQCTNAGTDMVTIIKSGSAFIGGHLYINDSDLALTHDTADATRDRIDRIVVRLDLSDPVRSVTTSIRKGTVALEPVPPTLERTDTVYEISIAKVLIKGGMSTIDGFSIQDERLNDSVCGLASTAIEPKSVNHDMAVTQKDADGVNTEITYYNPDKTIFEVVQLSEKDVNGNYTKLSVNRYLNNAVSSVVEYRLTFDTDGSLIKRELI